MIILNKKKLTRYAVQKKQNSLQRAYWRRAHIRAADDRDLESALITLLTNERESKKESDANCEPIPHIPLFEGLKFEKL